MILASGDIDLKFGSWLEFVEAAQQPRVWAPQHQSSQTQSRDSWHGTPDFQTAVAMALRLGWPEGRDLMTESLIAISPKPQPFRSLELSVAGAFPIIPAFCAGSPESMVIDPGADMRHQNPVVQIDYCNGGLADIQPRSMMLRGAAVLSLADSLEHKGFSTEINLIAHTRMTSCWFKTSICVKCAGEDLDIDRMAFALAHPSVHRRLRLALIEQFKTLEPNHGSTAQTKFTDPDFGVIVIPGPSPVETPQSAILAVEIAAKDFLMQFTELETQGSD